MVRTIVPEKPDVRTVRKNGVYTQLLVLALVYMIVQKLRRCVSVIPERILV